MLDCSCLHSLIHTDTSTHLSIGTACDLLQVVLCPCGDAAKEDLLRGPPSQRHAHAVKQLLSCVQMLLLREVLRIPQTLAAGDDGHLQMVACPQEVGEAEQHVNPTVAAVQCMHAHHTPPSTTWAGPHQPPPPIRGHSTGKSKVYHTAPAPSSEDRHA